MDYKLLPEKRPTIKAMWWQRLHACQRVVEDWQKIIQVHSLVLEPHEDSHTWLKYAALCRKSGSTVKKIITKFHLYNNFFSNYLTKL